MEYDAQKNENREGNSIVMFIELIAIFTRYVRDMKNHIPIHILTISTLIPD